MIKKTLITIILNKKTILLSLFFLSFLLLTNTSYGLDLSQFDDPSIKGTAKFILTVNDLLNTFIWPILIMIGGLLDNSILFGGGMEARLLEIWIPVRNLVNLVFVVGLMGVAIYNMTGLADDSGMAGLKGFLPKIIIGIIAINFSFLGIKVFLDVITVSTSAVFALPDQVSEGLAKLEISNDPDKQKIFCLSIAGQKASDHKASDAFQTYQNNVAVAKAVRATEDLGCTTAECQEAKDFYLKSNLCNGFELSDKGKSYFSSFGSQNVALAMALDLSEIVAYSDVPLDIENVEKVLISLLISLIMYFIYAVSFIALFAVLLGRLVVLWVVIAVSPVLVLAMAVPALGNKVSALNTAKDKFIKNAIAPLIISVAMTIGWIMLKSIKSVNSIGTETLVFSSGDAGLPVIGLSTMQDVVVGIGVIAVTWIAITSAMSDTIAKAFTDKLFGVTKAIGSKIASLPISANVIPIKIDGQMTKASLGSFMQEGNKLFGANRYTDLNMVQTNLRPEVKNLKVITDPAKRLALIGATTETPAVVKQGIKGLKSEEVSALKNLISNANKSKWEAFMNDESPNQQQLKELQDAIKSQQNIPAFN